MKTPKSPSRLRDLFFRTVLTLSFPLAIFAQNAPPPTSPPPASDEVINLDEFTVTGDKSSGYRSATSISATGVGTQVKFVPIPISILTSEFLEDTAAIEIRDAIKFVPGVTTSPRTDSEYNIRGFMGNIAYRNGQYRRQNYGGWNVERTEVIKGAASIFYGNVRPGGIVNYMTTRPELNKQFADVRMTAGSEDYYRGSLFVNVPVGSKLAVRLGVGGHTQQGKPRFDYRDEIYLGTSILWRINDRQQLVVDLEKTHKKSFQPSSRGYASSLAEYFYSSGLPHPDGSKDYSTTVRDWRRSKNMGDYPRYNTFVPIYPSDDPWGRNYAYSEDSFQNNDSSAIDLEYLLKVTSQLVFQLQLNTAYDNQPGMRSNNGDQDAFWDGTVRMRFERWANIRRSYNAKAKLTYRFDWGKTNHTIQTAYEYQTVNFRKPGYFNGSTFSGSLYSNYFLFTPATDPIRSGFEELEKNGQGTFNSERDDRDYSHGAYVMAQSRFFKEKLHLLYGARYNKLGSRDTRYNDINYVNPGNHPTESAWTPQVGALVQILPETSLFAVYSESMEPNGSIDVDGNAAPDPIKGSGYDIGTKYGILNGRIAGTLSYYFVERSGMNSRDTERETITGKNPYYFYGNTHESRGIELDTNVAISDNFTVMAGYTHVLKAEVTKSNDKLLVGTPLRYSPKNMFTLWTRYDFKTGPLKRLSVGGGLRYNDSAQASDGYNRVTELPSFTTYDFLLSYSFKVFDRDIKAQFNVKNVTDKEYREGVDGYFGAPRSFLFTLSTRL